MRVTVDGLPVRVTWRYEPYMQDYNWYRATTCFIEVENTSETGATYYDVFSGETRNIYPDNFCKATGRKVALTKALKTSGFSKAQRKAIWDAYFSRDKKLTEQVV